MTVKEIERAYRKLARTEHPDTSTHEDKHERWVAINDAKEILTDDEKRRNWEEFGDARGPQPISWGLALPQWLIEEDNHYKVLFVYFCVMVGVMPLLIGSYYFKNLKNTGGKVRMTTQWGLFREALSQDMNHSQIIEILCAALEFNDLLPTNATDGDDVSAIVAAIVAMTGDKNMENLVKSPFNTQNNVKVKMLLMAHLFRVDVPARMVREQQIVLETFPRLIDGVLSMAFMKSQQQTNLGFIVTRAMEVSQMITQARKQPGELPVFQLPHVPLKKEIHEEFVKAKSMLIQQALQMKPAERRSLFKFMNDKEYKEAEVVMNHIPMIKISTEFEASGEASVTPGSIVTLRVKITRANCDEWLTMHNDGSWQESQKQPGSALMTDESGGEIDEAKIDAMFAEAKRKKQLKKAAMSADDLSPVVYAPHFPQVKHERWWLIVSLVPRDQRTAPPILAAPQVITNLSKELEKDVMFTAPGEGRYNMAIQIKSADYAGCDARRVVEFAVSAPQQPNPQAIVNHYEDEDDE